MPIPSQYRNILDSLLALTEQGRIPWSEGPLVSTIVASLKGYTVTLTENQVVAGTRYAIGLLNTAGRLIDSFAVVESEEDFTSVRELWVRAKRQASRVDEAIADLERELTALRNEPFPTIAVDSASLRPGQGREVRLMAGGMSPPGLGAWTIDIDYDSSIVSVTSCSALQGGVCNPQLTESTIRVTGASAVGLVGTAELARITFSYKRAGSTTLAVTLNVLADATIGNPRSIDADTRDGQIICVAG